MTVSSLWSMLDEAGCGSSIGVMDLMQNKHRQKSIRPLQDTLPPLQSLAVDLSIWICEAISSLSMRNYNVNPALYLVFQRTIKLLKLGINLIFVVEGKQRMMDQNRGKKYMDADAENVNDSQRNDDINDAVMKNRSRRDRFWRVCELCKEMLSKMGLYVLQAGAEGEALCAYLNQKGYVDGVISNDGDCFLYGAKVVLTRFSSENLDKGQVKCFHVDHLVLDNKDRYDYNLGNLESRDKKEIDLKKIKKKTISLNREDLVAFALLTGSDISSGVPHIGVKKALRFISICKHRDLIADSASSVGSSALEEIKSWNKDNANDTLTDLNGCGDETEVESRQSEQANDDQSCSQYDCFEDGCLHKEMTSERMCTKAVENENFLRHVHSKARSLLSPHCGMEYIIQSYLHPKIEHLFDDADDVLVLQNKGSKIYCTKSNDLKVEEFLTFCSLHIVKGKNQTSNREFITFELSKLLARQSIIQQRIPINPDIMRPIKIINKRNHKNFSCYEIRWIFKSPNSKDSNESVEFISYEWQNPVQTLFPNLVASYKMQERKMMQRCQRRIMFTGAYNERKEPINDELAHKKRKNRHFNLSPHIGEPLSENKNTIKKCDTKTNVSLRKRANQVDKSYMQRVPQVIDLTEISPIKEPVFAERKTLSVNECIDDEYDSETDDRRKKLKKSGLVIKTLFKDESRTPRNKILFPSNYPDCLVGGIKANNVKMEIIISPITVKKRETLPKNI